MTEGGATYLVVRLVRNGQTRIALRLPAMAVGDLVNLVSPDVRARCAIDEDELVRRGEAAVRDGYPVGDVLRAEHGDARLHISLE